MDNNIQSLVNNSILKRNVERSKDYQQKSWHASSLGSCMRGVFLKRLGIAPDKELDARELRKFDVGNKMEDWLVELIKMQEGLKTETQVRVESKEWNLSGKADLVIYEPSREVIEVKTQHSKSFWWNIKNGNKPQRHHEYQLWVYLWLLGFEKGRIVYVSKDDLAIQEYEVKSNDISIKQEVSNYISNLNTAWKDKSITSLLLPSKSSWQEKFCSYHLKCTNEDFLKSLSSEKKL